MVEGYQECGDLLTECTGLLVRWLERNAVSPGRSVRTVHTFARFSRWVSDRGRHLAEVDEALVDEYIAAEQQRSGSRTPAAAQYLPLVKRFFADRGLMQLRGPASRGRNGVPRLLVGPLSDLIIDLVAWLDREGYARGTAASVACTAARLSVWLDAEGFGVECVDDALLARFVAAQARGGVRHPSSARRIVTVRKFLLTIGVVTDTVAEVETTPLSPVQECLEEWVHCLRCERGLGPATTREYRRWIQPFVTGLAEMDGSIDWHRVDTQRVNQYVREQGRGYSIASRRHLITALRSLLIWAWRTGRLERSTAAMVLGPPTRRSGLPRALTTAQVEAIEAAADTTTMVGLRDHAVAVMIARLGLRAGEVASLRLDDLDWRRGGLAVNGKGGRLLTLPIPVDVGDALVAYLRDGRPAAAADRSVFVRARPPLVRLSSKGISGVVARLAERAGLGTIHAHRLRHTAATQVLARGGSLVEARELLGHARTDTTMIYAKTDLAALAALVVPWGRVPGALS
jgi:site-specific recombinase XerD